jgi:HlyD family secretion protein
MTLGGLLMLGAFGAALILASVTEYNITVRAIANVRPAGEVHIIQAETGGTIKRIEVNENQLVARGDAIAYIDDPRLYDLQNQKRYWQGYIQQEKARLIQVKAQLRALDTRILNVSGLADSPSSAVWNQQGYDISQMVDTALAKIAKSRLRDAEKLARQRETLLQDLDETNQRISDEYQSLQRVEAEIGKSVIRAQTDGKILKLDIRSPGQTVRPGEAIGQIVPTDTPLVVKARVAAQDIGEVKTGQTVQLRVSAYPYPDYGTLRGTVTDISPDARPCEGNCLGVATAYYEAIVQPETPYLVKGESLRDREAKQGAQHSPLRQYPLQPGMEVTADIISRKERVITFILRKARLLTDL